MGLRLLDVSLRYSNGQRSCAKRNLFAHISFDALSLVTNEAEFREHFEAECKRLNETRTQTLIAKLEISFDHIQSFIHLSKTATLDQGEKGYAGLIWRACFAVIEAGFLQI